MSEKDERTILGQSGGCLPVRPFLKWPGGKRWLVPLLRELTEGIDYSTYREPFLGGGAFFFSLRPKSAVLSDVNEDLINTYRQVKYRSQLLLDGLRELPINQITFDQLRRSSDGSPFERAVRFLYLNRTAFGGMYRLNQRGEFNVPFGGGNRTTAPLWERDLLGCAAKTLRRAKLRAVDFESALSDARAGELVYCDPTYTVAHDNNGFIRYNERNFSWDDQKRLAQCCRSAASRGAFVIVSNAYHREVLRLFDPPRYISVSRKSRLCPQNEHRRSVDEYVFVFPPSSGRKPTARVRRGFREE